MGEMKRAIAREVEERKQDRFASTLVIATAIIAAIRLARESKLDPREFHVQAAINTSVALAKAILDRIVR